MKILTIKYLLAAIFLTTSFNLGANTPRANAGGYPWSDTFSAHGISDSISLILLSVSQGQPFYQTSTRAGLWGLTPPTALRYGLTINSHTDERYDPLLSSKAAAEYMSDLIKMYDNDTAKAIFAYHNGAAVATKTFISDSMIYSERISDIRYYKTAATIDSIFNRTGGIRIRTTAPIRISTIMSSYGIDHHCFRLLNPSILIYPDWIMQGTSIYLPDTTDMGMHYIAEKMVYDSLENIKAEERIALLEARRRAIKEANAETIYRVKSGDTLGKIARKYGVTVRQIKTWNGLKSDMIRIGQRLKIRK